MTIYYKDGFFDDAFGSFVPEGAVAILDEQYIALLEGQAQGKQIVADKSGSPILLAPQPSPAHEWNGSEWVISPEKQTAYLAQRKETILSQLANRADQLKNGLLVGYPQTEIESFYRQEKEALAKQANPKAETPMLEQIARVRGVPLDLLIEKVIEKSAQFAVAIGIIIGQRQAFEDRLMAIETLETLEQLEQEVNAWQFQAS
ncbi:putative tail fiber assembly protein [Haemophilus parahaemolyticus]|uniref:Putative tail fiber assembly protein n=1 Tax=Haemophilus parahaemolyticus TaxID=735 RepID=A0A377I418_HAEPH|nr:hypothetical protein [Haemophilus parahaemolyticus]STO64740.1 putative tail fiber assembly protein [Haemophilus parahaemolyticus]